MGRARAAVVQLLAQGLRGQPHGPCVHGGLQPAAVDLPGRARRAVGRRPRPALDRGAGLGAARPPAAVPQRRREHADTAIHRLQETSTTVGILAIVAAIWFASSFWGALDTAFCQIYHRDCRSWVRQKLFAPRACSRVVLLFIVATVAVPALQSLLVTSGRATCRSGSPTCAASSTASRSRPASPSCSSRCASPTRSSRRGRMPWRCVWPGALGATLAIGVLDYALPALPAERLDAARRHDVRVRADRARVVLRARDHRARRSGRERTPLRTSSLVCARRGGDRDGGA